MMVVIIQLYSPHAFYIHVVGGAWPSGKIFGFRSIGHEFESIPENVNLFTLLPTCAICCLAQPSKTYM